MLCYASRKVLTRWPRDWSSDVCSSVLLFIGEIHAHQDVAGHPDAVDDLTLTALDLNDFFHGDLHLVDVVLHVQTYFAALVIRFNAVFVAGIWVNDVPRAELTAQSGLESCKPQLDRGVTSLRRPPGPSSD